MRHTVYDRYLAPFILVPRPSVAPTAMFDFGLTFPDTSMTGQDPNCTL